MTLPDPRLHPPSSITGPTSPLPPPSPLGPMPAVGQGKLSPVGMKVPQVFRGVANTLGGGMYKDKSADQVWADLFQRGHAKQESMPFPQLSGILGGPSPTGAPPVGPPQMTTVQMLQRIFSGEGSKYLNPGTLQALLRMSRGETIPRPRIDTWDV